LLRHSTQSVKANWLRSVRSRGKIECRSGLVFLSLRSPRVDVRTASFEASRTREIGDGRLALVAAGAGHGELQDLKAGLRFSRSVRKDGEAIALRTIRHTLSCLRQLDFGR